MQTRDGSCNTWAKNVSAFCPCPKTLPETTLKSFELTAFAEDISKQSSIDYIAQLLVPSNMQIYNEKKKQAE